ncbi:cytochrome P450 704C1-like isoform X2 [Momordica charantia]|uniref:Cytochrome P450 704C1-like isoform X2 n=1 Tax=Momordica charantia TaxID=3673 RepID=A0A6J1CZG0_MOMCH|nr:cytochrome P450 704C1-like isoform X2 [Momordica charantia]
MEVNIINIFFTVVSFILFTSFLFFLIVLLRTLAGKSITNSEYAPVYGSVYGQALYLKKLFDHLTEVAKKHGTFRLVAAAYSEIYTIDPRNIEHILKTKFDKYSKGSNNQAVVGDLFGEGIFAVDGEKWKQQRKLASYEFSTRILRDFSCSVFRRNAAKLVGVVSQFAAMGRPFDIQDLLMRSALDSIFKVGFGVELNCLEESSKEGIGFMKAFDDSSAQIFWRYIDPLWKLKRFLNIGSEGSLRNNIKTIDAFVHQLIRDKRKLLQQPNLNDKEDILWRFLMESEKDPTRMNDQYLRDIVLNFMLAGKDSSGGTLSWFFYMLCKNPLIQEKIAEEVKQVVGIEGEEADINLFIENLTDSALDKMHYLHAALTETLRLYPPVPVDGRTAEIDDILPDGYKLRKGDGVYYLAYSMGRMPCLWGEDAEDFKPERWLENGTFRPESPFKFIAFHAGPRMCLGKEFAYRQMKIVSASLLQFFRFKLGDATRNVTYRIMLTLHIDGGLPLLALPRKTKFA